MMKKRKDNIILMLFITLVLSLSGFTTAGAVTAKAETIHTVNDIAESIVFITFKKGYSEEKGKFLGVSFFFPKETYVAGNEYGVAVFPEKFIARYDLNGDYISRKETDGIAISLLKTNGGVVEGGRIASYSITNIPESALDMQLVYVFFVSNSEGEVAYKEPVICSFQEATLENPSTDELLSMAIEKQKVIAMEGNFEIATDKISELVDSIWIYLVIGCSTVVVIWGAYIGIRIAVAKKNEQRVDTQGMVKRLVIGIVIMFVLAGALPLLIKGLAAWIGG